MRKALVFCMVILCHLVARSQNRTEYVIKETMPVKKIIVLDVPNGKVDLQKAKKQLISNNKIRKGAKATYVSGNEHVITDGFVAEKGSEFVAVIENTIADSVEKLEQHNISKIEEGFRVYPNPTSENLVVNLPNVSSGKIQIIGLSGQIVFERKISKERNMKFSIVKLPVGVYMLHVETENYRYTKKIVKN